MFTARRPALRPRDLFRRGVGSILEIGPPRSRFHEFVPRETVAEAFGRYRAEIERDLGAAVARWEAEVGGTSAAESLEEPFRGPLPPPELLRRYDEAVPGAGERILDLAEEEQRKRASSVNGAVETMRRGQSCGLAVTLAALGVVAHTAYLGHPVVATILGGATLTSLVTVFVAGRPSGGREGPSSEPTPRSPDPATPRRNPVE